MGEGILDDIRIVDMAAGIGGSVAALLLAEAGADVVKIEGPWADPAPIGAENGIRTWNRSKTRVLIDIRTAVGREELERLLPRADVLIHEFSRFGRRPSGWTIRRWPGAIPA